MNVLLNWESNSCSAPLSQRVEYKKKSETNWTLYTSVPCGINSIYINDLDDDTLYEFRVGSLCNESGTTIVLYSAYSVLIKINCVSFDTLTPTDASINYTFAGNVQYQSYDVVLLSDAGVELQRQNKVYAISVTGTFTGLLPNSTYKIKIEPKAFFNKFTKTDCPAEVFLTTDVVIPDCSLATFDIIVVNDESGSIKFVNYESYIKPGILDIVRQMSSLITSTQIRFGVIGFSNFIKTRVVLSDDYPYIFNAITAMGFLNSSTGSAEGLRKAKEWIDTQARNVPCKVIFITDGNPNKCYNFPSNSSSCPAELAIQQAIDAATSIKNTIKGGVPVEIIAVGVTADVNSNFLENQIATSPTKYFAAATFEDFETVAQQVALSICANMPAPVADPCIVPTAVTASLLNQTNQTCLVPTNVTASLLTLNILCNGPTNVTATIRLACVSPGSVTGTIL